MTETSNASQAHQAQPRALPESRHRSESETATNERLWPSDTSRSSTELPQAAWIRQASPRLVNSFQLADEHEWDSVSILSRDSDELESRTHVDAMTNILQSMGWLPSSRSCSPWIFFLSFSLLNLLVVALTFQGYLVGAGSDEFKKLQQVDSVCRNTLYLLAHFFMYCIGGNKLVEAFQAPGFTIPFVHMVVLIICLIFYWGTDVILLSTRSDDSFRRVLIMIGRLPSAVSVMVMMGIPKTICQDLVRVVLALQAANIPEAQRLYCIFWKHMRLARKWYNAIMTPNFFAAIVRLPVGCYALRHFNGEKTGNEFPILIICAAVDIVTLLFWVQPAITIRMNHGVVLSLAVEKAGQQKAKARELATMMASLHPLVGLKFLGFIVTWRLVAQVATLAPVLLTFLTFCLEKGTEEK